MAKLVLLLINFVFVKQNNNQIWSILFTKLVNCTFAEEKKEKEISRNIGEEKINKNLIQKLFSEVDKTLCMWRKQKNQCLKEEKNGSRFIHMK